MHDRRAFLRRAIGAAPASALLAKTGSAAPLGGVRVIRRPR